MVAPNRSLELWLPALARFDAGHPLRQWLHRADPAPAYEAGFVAGLGNCFDVGMQPLPAAALIRQELVGDAGNDVWLGVDPAWVQPELNGVRLMACGGLSLTDADARAFADALQPAFDDAGVQLQLTTPQRWHLRLPASSVLPPFDPPEQALGEDLLHHLPPGAQGRRWRVLLNDVQVLLHQHPLNRERTANGLAPINSVWLWGGGALPSSVHSALAGVLGDDPLLLSLAASAGIERQLRTPERVAAARAGWLVDLHDMAMDELTDRWWPAIDTLARRQPLGVRFLGGERWRLHPWHRWRFWRGGTS